MKPTEEQFEEYVAIRYIESISDTGLNKPICLYIMKHFVELAEEYEVEI